MNKKNDQHKEAESAAPLSRRDFITRLTAGAAATVAISQLSIPGLLPEAQALDVADTASPRFKRAVANREKSLRLTFRKKEPKHLNNREEKDYPYIATFHKGLPCNALGEVDESAFALLKRALKTGSTEDFENLSLGSKKLKNPLAAFAHDLQGYDSCQLKMRPAPRIDSAENSSEMGELYWQALCRDVAFTDYGSDSMVGDAAADLSTFSDFRAPKENGVVTSDTLFRGNAPGCTTGPYISQFLFKDIPLGCLLTTQKILTPDPGIDFLTRYDVWLHRQGGNLDGNVLSFDGTRRYIRNGRDLARYVHIDELYQAYFNACLILSSLQTPYDSGNPYNNSLTMEGFGTLGGPHILSLVAEVATRALKAAWFQKWLVHRRLRPETFGGRVHNHYTAAATYPINSEILNSSVLPQIFAYNAAQPLATGGTYLLPQAYPEAAPLHPAYPSGHATVAGACVTVLKAFFDESFVIPNPVVPDAAGTALVPYNGPGSNSLTVGGELNKLAANIGMGRNFGGIHWRTDMEEGLKLGEAVAIGILKMQNITYRERNSFTLTKFSGETVVINNR